jgi:hypothetical protein
VCPSHSMKAHTTHVADSAWLLVQCCGLLDVQRVQVQGKTCISHNVHNCCLGDCTLLLPYLTAQILEQMLRHKAWLALAGRCTSYVSHANHQHVPHHPLRAP